MSGSELQKRSPHPRKGDCPRARDSATLLRRGSLRFEEPSVPREAALDTVDDVRGLAKAVSFPRVTNENGLDADLLQRDVHLLRFLNRDVLIQLSVDEHRRRLHFRDVRERRSFPECFGDVALPWVPAAPFDLRIILCPDQVCVTEEIADSGGRNR